jgi:hypothetical protein
MTREHPASIEIVIVPDLMGAEMLRLLADAIEADAIGANAHARNPTSNQAAFKLRRSKFKVLP